MGSSTERSVGASVGVVNGGARVAVAELSSEWSAVTLVEGRNWKSAKSRSAHLLVAEEKLFGILLVLALPLTALSFGSFLVISSGSSNGDNSDGIQMPMLRCLKTSICFGGFREFTKYL